MFENVTVPGVLSGEVAEFDRDANCLAEVDADDVFSCSTLSSLGRGPIAVLHDERLFGLGLLRQLVYSWHVTSS